MESEKGRSPDLLKTDKSQKAWMQGKKKDYDKTYKKPENVGQAKHDIFGEEINRHVLLRERFIEPPFSVLDSKCGNWQKRKHQWNSLGMKSEVGRAGELTYQNNLLSKSKEYTEKDAVEKGMTSELGRSEKLLYKSKGVAEFDHYRVKEGLKKESAIQGTSIFDPVLCELMYRWFCPENGTILDPFAGGSVRGIVANHLGYKYTGIELRPEQIESNIEQGKTILPGNEPEWICGDSEKVLNRLLKQKEPELFDFVLSCPPYANLEVYSELPDDLSNMGYPAFLEKYREIIKNSCALLKPGRYAAFIVSEVRGKNGAYLNFVGDTVKAFLDIGMQYYNSAVLLNMVGSAPIRATRTFQSGQKLIRLHQNVEIFKKEK